MKSKLKKAFLLLLISLIIFGIGLGIAFLIANQFHYKLSDVLFVEGLIFALIGAFMSMKGNPSGASIAGMGQNNAQLRAYENIMVTKQEQELTDYHKNFLKQSIVKFEFANLTMIISGVFLILLCIIISV